MKYVAGIAVSFILTVLLQYLYINCISKLAFFRKKETISANKKPCIMELHKQKGKIPTMGGMAMAITFMLVMSAESLMNQRVSMSSLLLLFYACLGAVDDWIKIKQLRDGITPGEKLIGLACISVLITYLLYLAGVIECNFLLPVVHRELSMNPLFALSLFVFLMILSCNSVNLTDGIDGLAAGHCGIVFATIGVIAWRKGETEITFQALVLFAICLGMLVWNRYPAKVFMGDTGSLFLGGAIGVLCIELRMALWIPLFLGICIWEVLSVIIQLTSLRFRKKKVFLIAPFHHHLEKLGWTEIRINLVFWTITLVCSAIAVFIA